MAEFGINDADNYGNAANSGSFFQLKDDKDSAKVRFLYSGIEDVKGYAVHQVVTGVDANGKEKHRYVNCLRNYTDPLDVCPLCKANYKVMPKLFIKLYNEDAQECQLWERGKSYFQKLGNMAARMNPLCNYIVEIVRNGKRGDKNTEYNFWPVPNEDPIDLNDEKYECKDALGTIILDKTADEMEAFLSSGSFPETENNSQPQGNAQHNVQAGVERRTPSNTPRHRAF